MSANTLLPIFVPILVGYIAGKITSFDIRTLSTITFYIFLPALVFSNLIRSSLTPGDAVNLLAFAVFSTIIVSAISKAAASILRYTKQKESALLLSTVFPNTVNLGAPIILFAMGQTAFQIAIAFGVINGVVLQSLGVYYASLGKVGWRKSLRAILRYPAIYAVLIGMLINASGFVVDEIVANPINILANAYIPLSLLIFGMQLSKVSLKGAASSFIPLATVIKLIVSPMIGAFLVYLLGVQGLARQVLILQFAMPPAITTTLFAVQFDDEPNLVSTNTLVATISSFITLTILMSLIT